MPESVLDWEIALTLWLQAQGEWLAAPMNLMTFTGGPLFFLFVLPIVYWSVNRRFGLRLALALLITLSLNSLLKIFFHAPRPYWYNANVRLLGGGESGFGLPSGHAQTSVVLWGMIAAAINSWWAWVGAVAIIVGVGISRIHIGVHFTTDRKTACIGAIPPWASEITRSPSSICPSVWPLATSISAE
jgi:membrane-associated phospholipid phosphatase